MHALCDMYYRLLLNARSSLIAEKVACSALPCFNGATCMEHRTKQYQCHCNPGWTGRQCETSKCLQNFWFLFFAVRMTLPDVSGKNVHHTYINSVHASRVFKSHSICNDCVTYVVMLNALLAALRALTFSFVNVDASSDWKPGFWISVTNKPFISADCLNLV